MFFFPLLQRCLQFVLPSLHAGFRPPQTMVTSPGRPRQIGVWVMLQTWEGRARGGVFSWLQCATSLPHATKSYILDLFKRSDPEGIFKQWLYQSYTSQISCLHYISLKDRWQKMCVYRLMYWYRILFLPHIGVGQRNCMLGPTYIGLWQCEGWFWTAVRYVQCIIC